MQLKQNIFVNVFKKNSSAQIYKIHHFRYQLIVCLLTQKERTNVDFPVCLLSKSNFIFQNCT